MHSSLIEDASPTKNVSIVEILAGLDKDTLATVRRGSEITKQTIPTASFGLNLTLGGGLYLGKQHTVWGNEQAGKSAMMMQTIGINQALGNTCALIDAEHSFDADWAARLGVDVDKLIVSEASTIGDVANLQIKLIDLGVKLIVIDSTSALWPKSFLEDGEVKEFQRAGQIGQFAKDMGQMCKMVQGRNWNTAVVHISQVKMDLGNSFMPGMKPDGGKQTEHTDAIRVRLTSSKSEKQAIMGKIQRGEMLIEERIGRNVTWKIEKNKVNGRYDVGEYSLYVLGDKVGVDRASELLAYGIRYGIIAKGGAWYTLGEERFQGEAKVLDYIKQHSDVASRLETEIAAQSL
jgi:recombination protein RecA